MNIKEFKDFLSCDDVELAPKLWKGHKVYRGSYKDETPDLGLPHILLEKDGNFAIMTGEETFEIIDSVFPNEED